jgi:peptide/nickel transport system substrate-binding protein
VQIVKDQAALPRLLRTGELDLVRLQPEQWRAEVLEARGPILGDPAIRAVQAPELGYVFIGWNQARPQLRDARVRRALTHALDRARIVSSIFAGLGTPISGPFPRQQPCYDASIAPLPYDLDAARRLLDEAGWRDTDGDGVRDAVVDGARVPLEFALLTYASSAEWDAVSSLYQSALASIGVRMRPEPAEWSVMLQRLDARTFDAHVGVWVVSWDVDPFPIWHSSEADKPKSLNRIAFKDAEADRLIEAIRVELDDARRVELCHRFHARLHAEQPYTFIYQRDRAFAYRAPLNPPELQPIWPHRDLRFLSFAAPRP